VDSGHVRGRVKQIIADLLSVDAAQIPDEASLVDELDIDSLTLLEVGVEAS
jgi:acyl carrier protein